MNAMVRLEDRYRVSARSRFFSVCISERSSLRSPAPCVDPRSKCTRHSRMPQRAIVVNPARNALPMQVLGKGHTSG